MISKNTIKLIKSLSKKKYRQKENLFLVEGDKNVLEVLNSDYKVVRLLATKGFISKHQSTVNLANLVDEIEPEEIKKLSLLMNPQNCIAICAFQKVKNLPASFHNNLTVYLDEIQDPGNLGTIIRICDWFGINQLFCSPETADFYNPKVIQASMGSFCRVKTWYCSYKNIIDLANHSNAEIIGAFLEGQNIYTATIPEKTLLVIGNEGNGINPEMESFIHKKITIPSFAVNNNGAESLNAGIATGIICAEIKRRHSYSK